MVETHRKRQLLEEELKAAAAAVASLNSQSSSLEASIVTLRGELEHAVRLKTREDATLQTLTDQQRAAIDQLAAVSRDLETALADQGRVANAVAVEAENARAHWWAVIAKRRGRPVEDAYVVMPLSQFAQLLADETVTT